MVLLQLMPMKRILRFWPVLSVVLVLVGVPVAFLVYQHLRTGMTWKQILHRMASRASGPKTGLEGMSSSELLPPGEKIDFLVSQPIGDPIRKDESPRISHVLAVDLDRDGLLDVVVCDALRNQVSWIRQYPRGVFTEHVLADNIAAPAHVQAIDFDGDGHLDLMVASLGMLFPSNDKIGSVIILHNDGKMNFTKHVVVDHIARVSDVRAADLNGDGKMDLAVAQFGYDDGETRWIENLGNWQFTSHILQKLSGPINVEIADLNGDGHQDLVVLVSQEWEEIWAYISDGKGNFTPKLLYGSANDDFGSSGISLVDLNQDGKIDILYTNGDAFDYIPPRPRPWHGVQWLENKGNFEFEFHRIANFAGAYNAKAVDINGDGHLDLLVVSAFNFWEKPSAMSFIWLENDGHMHFRRHDITNTPTHLLALDAGDFDGSGKIDFVTGGIHICPPYDRMSRVTLWKNNWTKGSRQSAKK